MSSNLIKKTKKISYISLAVVGFGIMAAGFFLSFNYSSKTSPQNSVAIKKGSVESASFSAVKNASFSAVPLVTEKIVAAKSFASSITTQKGDDLLVLVNKSIQLPSAYVPVDLVSIGSLVPTDKGELMRKEALDHLVEMFAAAKASGYNLSVTSAYRSYASQIATFNRWVSLVGRAAASRVSALPGHSQHQLGTAVDLSAVEIKENLTTDFGKTPEGIWLAENSWKFGFVLSYPAGKEAVTGYSYEPWHFRYIGLTSASALHNLGWDLETYLKKYGVW